MYNCFQILRIKRVLKVIKILIAEDEELISNLIRINLVKSGYSCDCAFDGAEAADKISENSYDLILLDIMLPKIDGYELLEYAKSVDIPVIFITAMGTTTQKVKGLRLGAEDYITKPFEIIELLARVETVLRRYNKTEKIIKIKNVEINTEERSVLRDGVYVPLTLKEYELLLLFVKNRNIALYRETIYENIWGAEYCGDSRTIDLHVQRLKKKLGWSRYITAVYKVGYIFKP